MLTGWSGSRLDPREGAGRILLSYAGLQHNCGLAGSGGTAGRNQPFLVPNLQNVIAVSAGELHSVALTSDGRVWYWGRDGVDAEVHAPTQHPSFTGGVTQISAGQSISMALKTDGGVSGSAWVWGDLPGRGSTAPGIELADATRIQAGRDHVLAIKADGTIWGWGDNSWGQLGFGSPGAGTAYEITPKRLFGIGLLTAAEAGWTHDLVADARGNVWGWGTSSAGAVGLNPGNVLSIHAVAGISNVLSVSAGGQSMALKSDGTIWTWGYNGGGQLANGTPCGFPVCETAIPAPVLNFRVANNPSLSDDPDGDGLTTEQELRLGTDPYNADTNGDGIPDGAAIASGKSATNPDMDGDGVTNAAEILRGTDPFLADTDGDGVNDNTDAFPLDPTRWQAPPPTPGDTTPPVINLTEPTNAVLISSVPPGD